jgi:hypothetical protein
LHTRQGFGAGDRAKAGTAMQNYIAQLETNVQSGFAFLIIPLTFAILILEKRYGKS